MPELYLSQVATSPFTIETRIPEAKDPFGLPKADMLLSGLGLERSVPTKTTEPVTEPNLF